MNEYYKTVLENAEDEELIKFYREMGLFEDETVDSVYYGTEEVTVITDKQKYIF